MSSGEILSWDDGDTERLPSRVLVRARELVANSLHCGHLLKRNGLRERRAVHRVHSRCNVLGWLHLACDVQRGELLSDELLELHPLRHWELPECAGRDSVRSV